MKNVAILIPQGQLSMVNIQGTYQILNGVNGFLHAKGQEPLFDVKLVGLTGNTKQVPGLFSVKADTFLKDVDQTDLIIIPAVHDDQKEALVQNQAFIPWIVEQYKKGAEVASFCIGAYFLAATGLLKGKQCATHWQHANAFREMFPDVNLVDDKIMTEEDRIYTSGGAYSYLNLILYLIEKHAGREVAILTAKTFMIDIDRNSQSPFIIFQGQKTHEDDAVKKVQEYIENHYAEKLTVDQLASLFAIGRRSLERRFKAATSNTISEYIQRVKIEVAKKSLESSRKNITEVMYDVGYADTKAFRTTFKKITDLSPIAYKNKYNRESVVV